MLLKRPFIVVAGHEKGGSGKSTLCIHLVIGLLYFFPSLKITVIDLDMAQGTTYRFFEKRSTNTYIGKSNISYFGLKTSLRDSKKESAEEDSIALRCLVNKCSDSDIIFMDTPGSKSNFTSYAIFLANMVITPLNDSMVDIDILITLDRDSKLVRGSYSETVFNQRKFRLSVDRNSLFQWILVTNRMGMVHTQSSLERTQILQKISKKIGAEYFGSVRDHHVLREAFKEGCTIFDLFQMTHDISSIKIAVASDLEKLIRHIHAFYEQFAQLSQRN